MAWCLTNLPQDLHTSINRFRIEAKRARALKAFRIEASEDRPNTYVSAIHEDEYIRRIAYIVREDCIRLPSMLHSQIGCTLCGERIVLLQAIRLVRSKSRLFDRSR